MVGLQQAVSWRKIPGIPAVLSAQQKCLKSALVDTGETKVCFGNLERDSGLFQREIGKNGVLGENMNNLLYISYFAPYDRVDHAGGKVHNFYIKCLQKEPEYDVTLLSMCYQRETDMLDLKQYGIKHRLVVLDRTKLQKYIRMAYSGPSYLNPWDKYGNVLLNYERMQLARMIRQYAKTGEKPDLIVLQWTQIILLMPLIKKLFPGVKIVAIEEDVLFLNFERRIDLGENFWQRYIAGYQYRNFKKRELKVLSQADQIVVNNVKDATLLLQNGIQKEKLFTSSIYFDNYSDIVRKSETCKDILFYGAMHRKENHISALWFIENVLPHLPVQYRFVVIGARPQKELLARQNDRIKVTGFVEDIVPYFETCYCLAAPLLLGAGIKVKILEALSAGIPVLTNHIGVEGIGCTKDREYWHCETAEEYIYTIRWMEEHPEQVQSIALSGKRYIADNFDLLQKYTALIQTWDRMLADR